MNSNSKKSGILLHPTALPSKYGIGDLGPEAYKFADKLVAMGQSYWQILPIGPTDFSNSPYSLLSTFAGNPLLISIDLLIENKLLFRDELPNFTFSNSNVEFEKVKSFKNKVFKIVCDNFDSRCNDITKLKFKDFCNKNDYWLNDYSEFWAYKEESGWFESWNKWDSSNSISESIKRNAKILQFIFDCQWKNLKKYCNERRLKIIGDMPIYVSYESADVWKNKNLFFLSEDNSSKYVAGCPPCEYSKTGQLWGNPIYNWKEHQNTNYDWWIRRFQKLFEMVDVVRLDHFIGFTKYWQVSGKEKTALNGTWEIGPGSDFFNSIIDNVENFDIIAEDLGPIDEDVLKLRDHFNFPGMRVVQFDFEDKIEKLKYPSNSILYSGTHDNNTLLGWIKGNTINSKIQGKLIKTNLKLNNWDIIEFILSQNCQLTIFQIQDLLELDSNARFNSPGTLSNNNWTWRLTNNQINSKIVKKMKDLTENSGRIPLNTIKNKFKEAI